MTNPVVLKFEKVSNISGQKKKNSDSSKVLENPQLWSRKIIVKPMLLKPGRIPLKNLS